MSSLCALVRFNARKPQCMKFQFIQRVMSDCLLLRNVFPRVLTLLVYSYGSVILCDSRLGYRMSDYGLTPGGNYVRDSQSTNVVQLGQ